MKMSSIVDLKSRAIVNASGRLGSYFSTSMRVDRLTRNAEALGELGLRPIALGAQNFEAVFQRYLTFVITIPMK